MKITVLAFIAACGGNPKANPCATRNSTYLAHFAEQSGNCGAVPDQVVNISASGEIVLAPGAACEKSEADGCTQRTSNCTSTSAGVTCTSNGSLEFASGGATASGTASISCMGAAICTSTYRLTYTRQ